ncbi:MAG: 4-aminobutyrate--2-oxoglutarate transaminase [Symbiobacteriia bacterium]
MGRYIQMKTAFPGPKSRELVARKEKVVLDALTLHAPVAIAEAHGALITDIDGNTYIDLTGGLGCLNVGHSAPEVVAAVQDAARHFTHTDFSVMPYDSYVRLAERLIARAPISGPKKVGFFNSGAEAIENAIKIAKAYTGKKAVIAFEGAFHGRTLLTMSLTSKVKPYKKGFGPFVSDIYRLPYPNVYRKAQPQMSDEEYGRLMAQQLEEAFLTHVSPDETAAVILEPQQGEGGFVVPPKSFIQGVREITARHKVLLIVDEIQTGYGRTGKFFGIEHFGVEPDLITVGKSIAVGLPLSGVIGKAEIMDAPGDSSIGGTYVGNPVACAAGNAVLDIIERDDLTGRARHLGELYRARFGAMAEKFKVIGDIRGMGAMIGVEFVKDRDTKEPAPEIVNKLMAAAMERGVLTVKCGVRGNVLRILAPLVITDDQANEALDVIEAVLAEIA